MDQAFPSVQIANAFDFDACQTRGGVLPQAQIANLVTRRIKLSSLTFGHAVL